MRVLMGCTRVVRVMVVAVALVVLHPALAAGLPITEYPLPAADGRPSSIVAGPDGALWFADARANYIGRITTAGVATVQKGLGTSPSEITVGPDNALWFTESAADKIGRLTTAGALTEFPIPTPSGSVNAFDIAAGADGALWFGEIYTKSLGRMTTSGGYTQRSIPCGSCAGPQNLAAGPGGMWFTEPTPGLVGWRSDGPQEWSFIDLRSGLSLPRPLGIALGPDGAMWFTVAGANKIGRGTTSFGRTIYSIPTPDSEPDEITAGPDGAMWFIESNANKIGRITLAGVIREFPLPTPNSGASGIAAGPDGALWVTQRNANKIARVPTSAPPDVATDAAREIKSATATVAGSANPNGQATSAYFEYGPTTGYGQTTAAQDVGADFFAVPVSADLSGLTPGTEYHYRLVARNARGVTHGPDRAFNTDALPPAPPAPPAPPPEIVSVVRSAPTPILAVVSFGWDPPKRSGTVLARVLVNDVPAGATIAVSCRGGGCPFKSKVVRNRRGKVVLTRLFRKRKLRPRAVVEVRVTAPGRIGKVSRATIVKGKSPVLKTLCLPPEATKPERCR